MASATIDEKLAEAVRNFPVLYDKSNCDFKDKTKKDNAWRDVALAAGLPAGRSKVLHLHKDNFA